MESVPDISCSLNTYIQKKTGSEKEGETCQ